MNAEEVAEKMVAEFFLIFWGDRYPAFALLPIAIRKLTLGIILKTENKSSFSEYSTREFRFLVEILIKIICIKKCMFTESCLNKSKRKGNYKEALHEALNNSNTQKRLVYLKQGFYDETERKR